MNRFYKIAPKLLINISEIRTVSINKIFSKYLVKVELKPRTSTGNWFYFSSETKTYDWYFDNEKEASDFLDEIHKKIES